MKGFCEKCHDTVNYYMKKVDNEKEIIGKKLKYVGKVAYCDECKEEIFVPEVRDYNLRTLDEAYIEAEKLIKIDDFNKILKK